MPDETVHAVVESMEAYLHHQAARETRPDDYRELVTERLPAWIARLRALAPPAIRPGE